VLEGSEGTESVDGPARDGVGGVVGTPAVVSISDIHGYLEAARSALLTLSDHPDYEPVVETGADGRLQWAGNDYVLVFNGDLVDRGPDSDRVMTTVARLLAQAGPGQVRVTFGNHEMGILTPDRFGWGGWYSGSRSAAERRAFVDRVRAGHVVAAYRGYRVTYAHAGRPDPYDPGALNDQLVAAATDLDAAIGTPEDYETQLAVIETYPDVLGLGGRTGRGPGAGVAWLDFAHLPADAPPQVVGHTRQDEPTRKGAVVCQNVVRNNVGSAGGEAVLVETPDRLVALVREADGGVGERGLSLPDESGPDGDPGGT